MKKPCKPCAAMSGRSSGSLDYVCVHGKSGAMSRPYASKAMAIDAAKELSRPAHGGEVTVMVIARRGHHTMEIGRARGGRFFEGGESSRVFFEGGKPGRLWGYVASFFGGYATAHVVEHPDSAKRAGEAIGKGARATVSSAKKFGHAVKEGGHATKEGYHGRAAGRSTGRSRSSSVGSQRRIREVLDGGYNYYATTPISSQMTPWMMLKTVKARLRLKNYGVAPWAQKEGKKTEARKALILVRDTIESSF